MGRSPMASSDSQRCVLLGRRDFPPVRSFSLEQSDTPSEECVWWMQGSPKDNTSNPLFDFECEVNAKSFADPLAVAFATEQTFVGKEKIVVSPQ